MLLDYLGVTLAGAASDASRIAQKVLSAPGDKNGATYVGDGSQHLPAHAAILNGVAVHALDYDDGNLIILAHTGAVFFSPILAVGEYAHISGRKLLEAFTVGFEVGVRMSRVLGPNHYRRGWHATSIIGTLGAACAAAKVLGLNVGQTEICLGLSATQAGGLRANFGTMTKPFHAGMAAGNAIESALLAQAGFTACHNILETEYRFVRTFGQPRERANLPTITSLFDLEGLELGKEGVLQKIHPSCSATHAAIDAIIALALDQDLRADNISSI